MPRCSTATGLAHQRQQWCYSAATSTATTTAAVLVSTVGTKPSSCGACSSSGPSPLGHVPGRALSTRGAVLVHAAPKQAKPSKGFGAQKAPTKPEETCPCGSRVVYKQCCEAVHTGTQVPATPEEAVRAQFSALVKGKAGFLIGTYHPVYLSFQYEGRSVEEAAEQLRRDLKEGVAGCSYNGLKVVDCQPGSHDGEAFVTLTFRSSRRSSDRKLFVQGGPKDRSVWSNQPIVATTRQRTRLLKGADGRWLVADYELLEYPPWMEGEAERLKARAAREAEAALTSSGGSAAAPAAAAPSA